MKTINKEEISYYFKTLQDSICKQLENIETKATFEEDLWQRDGGGGGRTRVIRNGNVFAKGGVNFSSVHGKTPQAILKSLKLPPNDFYATGVSIVIHPLNPHVPIIHMNVRYFEMSDGTFWFGGGIDLTPIFIDENDSKIFHQSLQKICNIYKEGAYAKYKKWADDYFFLPNRNETRGIGGIFFDRITGDKKEIFDFVKNIGELFAPLYLSIIKPHINKSYNSQDIKWQSLRRSRYVEFNLLYDKGTKFGLDTNGRTESILMSMPPVAEWEYCYKTTPNSAEEKTQLLLKKEIDWTL